MKICFNEATTLKNSTLEKDLILCEKAGYDLIEIRLDKLKEYLKAHNVQELVTFFNNSRLKPYAFNALEFISFRDEKGYNGILSDMQLLFEVGDIIGCRIIIVVPTFDIGDYTKPQIAAETARALNDLAQRAEKYNFKLAFEFVGYPNCSVNTFSQAYDIVKTVDRDNVGIVLDCFHFYAMNSRIEDLQKADSDKIFVFHTDDSMDMPQGWLRDKHRLWPGDGCINLGLIIKTLKDIGYDTMASVELFNEDYWKMDAETAINTGKLKTEAVLAQVI